MSEEVIPAKRGRKPIEIVKGEFQGLVNLLENREKFTSRSALWNAVAAHPWAKHKKPRALTAQVAMLYAEKNGIIVTTPKGAKFSKDNPPPTARRNKVTQLAPPDGSAVAQAVKPKGTKGRYRLAIVEKCMDCSSGSKKEVRLCTVVKCPLYPVRPYKNRSANTCLTTSTYAASEDTSDAVPSE